MTESAPIDTKLPANVERLLKHLTEGSLAARLVHAHGTSDRAESMKAALIERLQQVRENLDGTKG